MLGIVVTEKLYRDHPDLPEGKLAKLRASVVNMRALADIARDIGPDGLGSYIRLGRGEEAPAAATSRASWPTPLEAVLGAVYLRRAWTARPGRARLFDTLMHEVAHTGAGARLEDRPAGAHRRAGPGCARIRHDRHGP